MSSPNIFPNGLNLAGTVFANGPATLQLAGPSYQVGSMQWLDTINGLDGGLPSGTTPEQPVKTLAQAVTNSAANGVIIVGAGSSETLTGSQALSLSNLSIFGCGTGSSRPRYTCNGGVVMWNITGGGVWIEGFYFPASTAVPTARIDVAGDGATIKDCYFECGASDTTRALRVNATTVSRIDGCSFVTTASRPAVGLEIVGAASDCFVTNCTFDGGSYGWTSYALKATNAPLRARIIGNTFINRSDLGFITTGSTYQMYGNNMGGTGNVLIVA